MEEMAEGRGQEAEEMGTAGDSGSIIAERKQRRSRSSPEGCGLAFSV